MRQVHPDTPAGNAGASLATTERDVDCALFALRRELALRNLRRRLAAEQLDGRTARSLSDLALALQAAPGTTVPAPRRWQLLRWLAGRDDA